MFADKDLTAQGLSAAAGRGGGGWGVRGQKELAELVAHEERLVLVSSLQLIQQVRKSVGCKV